MTVVVLHSSTTIRRIFSNVMGKMNPVSLRVCGGSDAFLEAVEDCAPDLLIVEKVAFQVRDYELVHRLNKTDRASDAGLMVVGYQFTAGETVQAIQLGVDELVLLPFSADDFLEKVRRLVHADISF